MKYLVFGNVDGDDFEMTIEARDEGEAEQFAKQALQDDEDLYRARSGTMREEPLRVALTVELEDAA